MSIAWQLSDLTRVKKNGIKVMSTFACGGGSSLGYKLAGCDVIAANDIDDEIARHYKTNLHPANYFLCPISDLLIADLPAELFGIDILDGSPPCSTFSISGNREKDWGKHKHFREGQTEQVLSDLFFDFLDVAERLKPKVVIAENVKGLVLGQAKGYLKLIFTRLKVLGYQPQAFLLNAADCGVPQRRERVFIFAVRNDISTARLILNPSTTWISAGEATKDLQDLTPAEVTETTPSTTAKKWWAQTRRGERFDDAIQRLGGAPKLWNWIRIDDRTPASTLTSSNNDGMLHWSECRSLTLREWKRLGSFPDDYAVESARIGKYLIGMSVAPRMMQYVATEVCKQWLGVK